MDSIYEIPGVYGDENQFINPSNRLNKILKEIKSLQKPPANVLDVGCGTGFLASEIKKIYPAASVTGVDISKSAVAIATTQHPGINFIEADAEQHLPFPDGSFDFIFSGEHIEHLRDVDTYLEELCRIAAPHATLIITTPNLASWLNRILVLFGRQPLWLEPSIRKILPIASFLGHTFPEQLDDVPSGHLRLYTADMLKKMLSLYGFATDKMMGCALLTKPVLKQVDQILSSVPSLGIGLIIVAKKMP